MLNNNSILILYKIIIPFLTRHNHVCDISFYTVIDVNFQQQRSFLRFIFTGFQLMQKPLLSNNLNLSRFIFVLTDVVLHPFTVGVRPLAVPVPVGDQTVLPRVGVVRITGNPVSVRERVPRGQPLEGPLFLQVRPTQPVYSTRTSSSCFSDDEIIDVVCCRFS